MDKLWSVAKGALIAAGGAALTYVGAWAASPDGSMDLGIYGPIVAAAVAVGINALRKLGEAVEQ